MKFVLSLFIFYSFSSFAIANDACIKILDPINTQINSALVDIEHFDISVLIDKEDYGKVFTRLEEIEIEIRRGYRPQADISRVRLLQALLLYKVGNNDIYTLGVAIDTIIKTAVPLRRGPVVNWHLAELYSRQGRIDYSINTLEYIKRTNTEPSIKVLQRLARLNMLNKKHVPTYSNIQSIPVKSVSRFSLELLNSLDKDYWGPYNPL